MCVWSHDGGMLDVGVSVCGDAYCLLHVRDSVWVRARLVLL